MKSHLKELRVKIVLAMVSTVAVLLFAMTVFVCAVTYNSQVDNVYENLESIVAEASQNPIRYIEEGGSSGPNAPNNVAPYELNDDAQASSIPMALYYVNNIAGQDIVMALQGANAVIDGDHLFDYLTDAITSGSHRGQIPNSNLVFVCGKPASGMIVGFAQTNAFDIALNLAFSFGLADVLVIFAFFIFGLVFSKWAVKPIAEAWLAQRRFIADASHELKTPLSVMAADTSLLLRNPTSSVASQSHLVESIEDEITNLSGLVDEMLFLAQSEEASKDDEGAFAVMDFSKLVERNALQFDSVAYDRGIEFDIDVCNDIRILGNEAKITRLVRTLLDNAFKYAAIPSTQKVPSAQKSKEASSAASEGEDEHNVAAQGIDGVNPSISGCPDATDANMPVVGVSLKAQDSNAVLSVSNTGPDIAKEDLPHIFERFYRADKARTRTDTVTGNDTSCAKGPDRAGDPSHGARAFSEKGGYGLGLAIAYEIAQSHNAGLSVTSENGKTVFTFKAPCAS